LVDYLPLLAEITPETKTRKENNKVKASTDSDLQSGPGSPDCHVTMMDGITILPFTPEANRDTFMSFIHHSVQDRRKTAVSDQKRERQKKV
jgi:hypothetical protein